MEKLTVFLSEQIAALYVVVDMLYNRSEYDLIIDIYKTFTKSVRFDNKADAEIFARMSVIISRAMIQKNQHNEAINILESILNIEVSPYPGRRLLIEIYYADLNFAKVIDLSDKLFDDPDQDLLWRSYMIYIYALGHHSFHPTVHHVIKAVNRWNDHFIRDMASPASARLPSWDGKRPIRVGLIHNFFHFTAYHPGLVEMFSAMGNKEIEFFAYDEVTRYDQSIPNSSLRPVFSTWRATGGLSDQAVHDQILADQIDVLVNLDGFHPATRYRLFAMRPASVQICWHNTFHTIGPGLFDFMIGDPVAVPASVRDEFAEVILDIPPCYFGFRPTDARPDCAAEPPVVKNGRICFGIFNRPLKLNAKIASLWARILDRVPGAILLFSNTNYRQVNLYEKLIRLLREAGIDADRYRVQGHTNSKLEYLARYDEVDISLDSLPLSGGFTTGDSLWQGVPVLTYTMPEPTNWAAHITVSMLRAADCDEFIATGEDDFIDRAVALADDIERLRAYRRNLRDHVRNSRLADQDAVGVDIASCFRRAIRIKQHWLDIGIIDEPVERRRNVLVD